MNARQPQWTPLPGAYFDPCENNEIARAQSLLTGSELGVCPPLNIEQARDVLAWSKTATTSPKDASHD